MGSLVVIAHAGHWLVDVMFPAPVIVVLAWILIANYRDKRRRRGEGDSAPSEGDEAP